MRARLFGLLGPRTGLFVAGLAGALVTAILDGALLVLLDPLLAVLFPGTGGLGDAAGADQRLEAWLAPLREGPDAVQRLVTAFLVALTIKNAAAYASAYCSVLVQEGVVRDLRTALYRHLLRVDLAIFQRTRGGQLAASIVSDTDSVKGVVAASLAALFQNAVMIATMLALLVAISPRLTGMVLVLAPVLVFGVRLVQRRLKAHARAFTRERGELTATVIERLGAMKLIRAAGAETVEDDAFTASAERYRKGIVRTQRFALLSSPVSELFGGAMVMLILWAAATPGVSGVAMDAGDTIVFLLTALRMMSPIKAITQFPAQLAQAEASAERVFALLDLRATEVDGPEVVPAVFGQALTFDHVTFGYDPAHPVLHDITLTVPKGTVVALVGPSGAGKTTLLELVPRFHDPQQGTLCLDGVPLPMLARQSLRGLIAVVSQDTVLLHDTVRANIAYGLDDASDEAIEAGGRGAPAAAVRIGGGAPEPPAAASGAAARAANAHEFIIGLPDRYRTVLGERGTRLSGGQRQRIAIARALLRDAPILILDEATSALDTESERLVQEAIDRLVQDRTVLVIAHRLATVRNADRIVVLEGGRIVEEGTHADLLARGGLYRRLHDLQFSAAEVTT